MTLLRRRVAPSTRVLRDLAFARPPRWLEADVQQAIRLGVLPRTLREIDGDFPVPELQRHLGTILGVESEGLALKGAVQDLPRLSAHA